VTRRLYPLAAVALAGLALGLWLAWPQPPLAPPPAMTRPSPVARVSSPTAAVQDTAGSAPERPTAPPSKTTSRQRADPPEADPLTAALDLRPVRCHTTGAVVESAQVKMIPSPEMMSRLADVSKGKGFDPQAVARGLFGATPPAQVDGDELLFLAPRSATGAYVQGRQTDGGFFFEEVAITWQETQGRCSRDLVLVPVHQVTISGRVQGLLDGERVMVSVCEAGEIQTDADGRFSITTQAAQGPCRVTAWRKDGALRAYGDFVDLNIQGEGSYDDISLAMPADDIGGIGAGIAPTGDGVVLLNVIPGGPGAQAGLSDGDVVTAVDGQNLGGMSLDDAVATITGPVGSTAVLTVHGANGEDRDVEVRRGWIEDE